MKKFWNFTAIIAAAVAILPLAACSDNDETDPYTLNYAYFYQPESTFATLEYKANGEFLVDVDDPLKLMPVRLTKPATSDMKVEVAIDGSLVEEYNAANNTDYVLLTGATIANPEMFIEKGGYITADSVVVNLGDHKQFQDGKTNYIVPVAIKAAGNATISKSSRIFLTFTSTYRANFVNVGSGMTVKVDVEESNWQTAYKTQTIEVASLWNADAPIAGKAAIDNSLIEAYNNSHSTAYKALEGTSVTPTFAIAQGENTGEVTLTLGDYSKVSNDETYLVPVVLSDLTGEGAELQTTTCYVVVTKLLVELSTSTSEISGLTQIPYESTWSAISNTVNYGEEDFTDQLINSSKYYGMEPGDEVTIDLGEVKTVRQVRHYYYAWYYAVSSCNNVKTSTDGTTWKEWGNAEMGQSQNWYMSWTKPINFRYIRWTVGDPSYSSDYGTFLRQISFYN